MCESEDTICEKKIQQHSSWSRFSMSLWILRVIVLGEDAMILIIEEKNLRLLVNSPRKRKLAMMQRFIL
jgi:hypothetical protein